MNRDIKLTLEQQFSLRNFSDIVRQMSREQAQDLSIEQHKQMILRKILYREIFKQEWKCDLDFSSTE
jgi:Phycobilisome degradation protein nblA